MSKNEWSLATFTDRDITATIKALQPQPHSQ
jgi:hypothetical protein